MRGVKGKRGKQKPKPDDPAQSERFIESAKALGLDESGKEFERAMDAILPKRLGEKKTGG